MLNSNDYCRTCYNTYASCCCGTRKATMLTSNDYCRTCYNPYASCCCNVRKYCASVGRLAA